MILDSPLTSVLLLQMTLFSTMMRDQRINVREPLLSADPVGNRRRLRDQLAVCGCALRVLGVACVLTSCITQIYSFQYKTASNAFSKGRVSLNGLSPSLVCVFDSSHSHTYTHR